MASLPVPPEINAGEPSCSQHNNPARLVRRPSGLALCVLSALLVGSIIVVVVDETPQAVAPAADLMADSSNHLNAPVSNTLLKDGHNHMADSFRVVDLHQQHVKSYERNSQFHDGKGHGQPSHVHNHRDFRLSNLEAKTTLQAAKSDVLEEFGGSPDCKKSGISYKQYAIKKGQWALLGGWSNHQKSGKFYFIYIRLGTRQQCQSAHKNDRTVKLGNHRSCVLLDLRMIHGRRPRTPVVTHRDTVAVKDTAAIKNKFPKVIGSEGDCFAKCRAVPWFLISPEPKSSMHQKWAVKWISQRLCMYAKKLGCNVHGGNQLGFMDYKTGQWKRCLCDSKQYTEWGVCVGKTYRIVNN